MHARTYTHTDLPFDVSLVSRIYAETSTARIFFTDFQRDLLGPQNPLPLFTRGLFLSRNIYLRRRTKSKETRRGSAKKYQVVP